MELALNNNGKLLDRKINYVNQIHLLGPYKRIKDNDPLLGNNCTICINQYIKGEYKRTLSCQHSFHKKCVDKWFKYGNTSCPICRKVHQNI